MAKLSKFFRVAVEGATTDGRVIERAWLSDIAATYNRATYGARVNMEHIRGITADKPFKAYGDVIAVKTEEVDIELGGKTEKKLALFAQVEPTDDLVAMNADKQKLYTSIEVNPNFAGTGKAYLMGLAVTDSPASLGTELLQFAAQHPDANPLASRKQNPGNLFTAAADGAKLEFDDVADPAPTEAQGLFAAATAFFKQFTEGKKPEAEAATPPAAQTPPPAANDNDTRFAALASGIEKMTQGIEAQGRQFTSALEKVNGDVATLRASIETTPAGDAASRALATGGDAKKFATDC